MDSGNSGSIQSSSGGDEEYDSRTESISPFLNPSTHFGSISSSNPPPHPQAFSHHHHHPPNFFDHPLDAFSQSPANSSSNTLYNLDSVWSRGLRSDSNFTDFGNLSNLSSSSSLSSSTQSLLGSHHQGPVHGSFPSQPSMSLRSLDGKNAVNVQISSQPPADLQNQSHPVKNPKKRTRASRRAPTTVLTTDTTNFRQMVQEFTGISGAPFSSSPYSRRFDLFGAGSLYPLRPSAQKVQISPPFVSSSPSSSSSSPFLINSNIIDTIAPPSTNNNVGSSSTNLQHQNLLNMQNSILAYQSLLQSPHSVAHLKHPLSNVPLHMGTKPTAPPPQAAAEHETAVAPTRLVDFPSNGNNPAKWRDDDGASNDESQGRYKLNCSATRSEKGLENVPTRGEGMVDSWICPSD